MRTAKDLIASIWQAPDDDLQMYITLNPDISLIEQAINAAQKEAIEECAKRVETVNTSRNPYEAYYEVDKQSILSIIDELK